MILVPETPIKIDQALENMLGSPGICRDFKSRIMTVPTQLYPQYFLTLLVHFEKYFSSFNDDWLPKKVLLGLIADKRYILFQNLTPKAKEILKRNFTSYKELVSLLNKIVVNLPSDFFNT